MLPPPGIEPQFSCPQPKFFVFVLTELSRLRIFSYMFPKDVFRRSETTDSVVLRVRETSEPGVPHAEPVLPAVPCFIIFGDQLSLLAATSGMISILAMCSHPHAACDVTHIGHLVFLCVRHTVLQPNFR
jgi:hypothetical protein